MTATGSTGAQASQWTPTLYARNGTVDIAYDTLAESAGEPLLLVMGLGTSRFWWPIGLCQEFAARRFAVARYDQRDAGESTRMPDTGSSNPFAALARKRGAYSSEDMTDDAIGVLDALGWGGPTSSAHRSAASSPSASHSGTRTGCSASCRPPGYQATPPVSAPSATYGPECWQGSRG